MSEVAAVSSSAAQWGASRAGILPDPEQVADGIWAIAAPIPEGQLTHTLSYVLRGRDDRLHLVDPGWDSDENLESLRRSLARLGFEPSQLASTISTHFHPDHLGIAARLRLEFGTEVLFSSTERRVLESEHVSLSGARRHYSETLTGWGVPADRHAILTSSFDRPALTEPVTPDRELADGDILKLGGREVQVVATPGHTSGHICLVDAEHDLIFTGDHVLPAIYSGIGIGSLAGTEPLADYLESLEAMAPYANYEVLPGHEYRFTGLESRWRQIAEHHLTRTREVRDLDAALGDATIWEFARRMTWTGGFDSLSQFSLHSALRQTQMHLELVRSGRADLLLDRH